MSILCNLPKPVFVQKFSTGFVSSLFKFVVVAEVSSVVSAFYEVKVSAHDEVNVVGDAKQGLYLGGVCLFQWLCL